jgi:hypothetical protein
MAQPEGPMKTLTHADKAIRLGTLALMLGLAIPPACSDDDVMGPPQEAVDGTGNVPVAGKGGKGGSGGAAGFYVSVDGANHLDGGRRGGSGGKGGAAGTHIQGDGAQHLDGSNRIDDAGADDGGP